MTIQARIKAINQIIKKKIQTEDDISAIVGKLAINVTFARKDKIMKCRKVDKGKNSLTQKIDKIKSKISDSPLINDS